MAARYDRHTSRVVVKLNTDVQISFPPRLAEGLADASPDDLATIEISPSGLVPDVPKLDAELCVPGLLAAPAWRDRGPRVQPRQGAQLPRNWPQG